MAKSVIKMIPLNKLVLSDLNVRKSAATEMDDQELYASIKAFGIKQNLLVHEHEGQVEVHAGGRRLKFAKQLVEEGVWAEDTPIACLMETRDQAIESSTAENTARAAMHPADEYAAFKAMFDKGANEDEIALKFGTTAAIVRKRMTLAALAPDIFEAFRANTLSIECAKAFAISADHARQMQVYESLRENRDLYPHNIRRALLETTCTANSRLARFVGLDDYKAAGGAVVEDLFSDHDATHLTDIPLLEQLALEKLEAAAADLRKDWNWAEGHITADFDKLREFGRLYPEPVEPDAALVAERDEIDARLAELAGSFDEETWTEELQAEEDKLSARLEELERLTEGGEAYTPAQMAIAGCIVALDYYGALKIEAGLVRPEDIPASPEDSADGSESDEPMEDAIVVKTLPASMARAAATDDSDEASEPGLSQALTEELRNTRNQIMKAHLAADFAAAFDLMVYTLARRALGSGYYDAPLDASVASTEVYSTKDALKETIAARMLEVIAGELDLGWMSLPKPKDFEAMCALPPEKKQAIFAFCTAKGLKQQLGGPKADPVIEGIGRRLHIDVATLWRPTARNYWGRVTKAHSLNIARELIDARWADDHASARKGDLAAALEAVFSDEAENRAGTTPATAAKTRTWLPDGLAITGNPAEGAETDEVIAVGEPADDVDDDEEMDPPADLPAFLTAAE